MPTPALVGRLHLMKALCWRKLLTFVLEFVDQGDIEQQELTVIKRSEFTS